MKIVFDIVIVIVFQSVLSRKYMKIIFFLKFNFDIDILE